MSETPDMDAPVTRREMHEALETWAGAIIARVTTEVITQTKALLNDVETRLMSELRQVVRGSEDELATRLVAIDQQYTDMPARVTKLEAKVFAPAKRKARPVAQPKRKRRS